MSQDHHLRYPIGRYDPPDPISPDHLQRWMDTIAAFPEKIQDVTGGLSSEQKNQTYRPGGWNIRQLVHHCADSHMNALIRFKLTLTEDNPTIRPYYEDRWAELADSQEADLHNVILLLKALHHKWVHLMRQISPEQWQRPLFHPEYNKQFSLAQIAGLYAWHCEHHLAHIHSALKGGRSR